MKRINCILRGLTLLTVLGIQGCASHQPEMTSSGDSFTNGAALTTDLMRIYSASDNQVSVLDFDSMDTASLCSKPNCVHKDNDCIVHRLDGCVPVLVDGCAYYFVDDAPKFRENDEGKVDLSLGSTLCKYDFSTNTEATLLHWDGGAVSGNFAGMLLHDGVLYFIDDTYSRAYDENGICVGYGLHGGILNLHAVRLSDMTVTDLGELYHVDELQQYYPHAADSGYVQMEGIFDNKIYFTVGFLLGENLQSGFGHYVTYYDLTDGTYHGEPEDCADIDFAVVKYLSEDYLAIYSDDAVSVYCAGSEQPVVLQDDIFGEYRPVAVFDDTLFCRNKVFALNTQEARVADKLSDWRLVAKYGDSYIAVYDGQDTEKRGTFKKIPAAKLVK